MAYQSFVDHSVASPLPKINYTMPNPRGLAALRNVAPSITSTEALAPTITKGALGRFGAGLASRLPAFSTGLKFLTGPIGAGAMAAGQILAAKETSGGTFEDDKLRELGILPPLPNNKINSTSLASHGSALDQVKYNNKVSKLIPNSITPISSPVGFATVGGKRINYEDIGNPLKDVALKGATNYSFGISPSETSSTSTTGATNLTDLLKTIQSVQPVQSYTNRMAALNTGNTTWDMNSLDKILAAKAEQQADTERYQQEVGALANLGSAQMNAEAARAGHQTVLQGEREKIAAMAPYYSAQAKEAEARAGAAPLAAKADVLKALTEQSKNDPILKASLDTLVKLGESGNIKAYNALAAKLAMITGKLIPPLPEED